MYERKTQLAINDTTLSLFIYWFDMEVVLFLKSNNYKVTEEKEPHAVAFDFENEDTKTRIVIKEYRHNVLDIFLFMNGGLPSFAAAVIFTFLSERYHISDDDAERFISDLKGNIQRADAQNEAMEKLTKREREVAELLLARKTPGQIADELMISVHTIKSHFKNMAQHLGIKSAAQTAIRQALTSGGGNGG